MNESKQNDLGEFIHQQRERANLSLRRLAERAGISNPYLSQIERGIRRPSAEILSRLSRALEISAFRLGLSPPEEMDDHKWYFDPRDLWPILVRVGFKPSEIRCHRHNFGLNTFAACRITKQQGDPVE